MNYTEKQIKLAGVMQTEWDSSDYGQDLEFQGEGIRHLKNASVFVENTGDCCEDLGDCELAAAACEVEKVELEQENADLREELDILEVISPVTYYDSTSCLHQHSPAFPCYNTTTTIQMYTSWVTGVSSSEWIVQRVDTVNGGPLSCLQGDGRFDVVRVSNGQIQNLTAGRNTRDVDTIALVVGEVYEVYVVFNNFGGRPECSRTTLLGSFTATSKGPVPI